MHNSSQNNFSNDDNFNNISQTTAQAAVMRTPVTYNNNFNQQPMSNVTSNNNVTISTDPNYQQYDTSNNNITISPHNYQQSMSNGISNNNDTISNHQVTYNNNFNQQPLTNVASSDHNYQQYDASNNNTISPHNYQQSTSNGISNNNDTISNYQQCDASNNIPHQNNYQQSMSNNVSLPQFYPQYTNQNPLNPPQSDIFPLLNSLGINISSPQATIIIMPATNSDIQNQLQQIHTYLNYSSLTNNSQTRPQQ